MAKTTLQNQNIRVNCRVCSLKISMQEIFFILCVTVLCCGVEFGYDVPGSLQVYWDTTFGLTSSQFSLFYSLYALPNIFLCFFGGFLIDNFLGIRTSTILYMMIAFVGSTLFALGGYIDIFWLMLLGRLVFGLGTEMGSSVCLNYLTFTRFKNTNMNLVFSISDNFGYIGTIAVYHISPRLFEYYEKEYSSKTALKIVLTITTSVFLLSTLCGVLMAYLKPNEGMTSIPDEDPEDKPSKKSDKKSEPSNNDKKSVQLKDFFKMFSTLLDFPPIFWILCLTAACFSNAIYTFESFSQGMFKQVYGLETEEVAYLITVLSITKIFFSIPLSMLVDRIGCNTAFVVLAILTAIMAHILIVMKVIPEICVVMLGLSYTMMGSSIVPMFAYPLKKEHYGLGYGLVTSFSNLSLCLCPLMAGKIIDMYGFPSAEIFYLTTLAIGFVCIIIVWIWDKKMDGILTMSPQERLAYEQRSLNSRNTEVDF